METTINFKNVLNDSIIPISSLVDKLQKTGLIFGVMYVKKDGEITELNGRFGVHKFLKGGKRTVPQSMWVIWENNRKRYTAIDPERIVRLNFKKDTFLNFSYKQ
jgi:hypothetical protein